jgi:hypothetical protein
MKTDYHLYVSWFGVVQDIIERAEKFPKSVRFTLADRMINLSFDVMELIVEAIYTKDRALLLKKANLQVEKLRIYVRLSFERRFLSVNQYEFLSERMEEAGRMVGGWIKKDA